MAANNIWHVKIRKRGKADAVFVATLHWPQAPQFGEVIAIEADGSGQHRGHSCFSFLARPARSISPRFEIEDDRNSNPPGHREADKDDF